MESQDTQVKMEREDLRERRVRPVPKNHMDQKESKIHRKPAHPGEVGNRGETVGPGAMGYMGKQGPRGETGGKGLFGPKEEMGPYGEAGKKGPTGSQG